MSDYRPTYHFSPMLTLRRQRMLPLPGRVTVRQGQKVKASDEVAYTAAEPRYRVLDVARQLRVPRSQADAFIQVKPGDRVQPGDVLAQRKGLLTVRTVKAPEVAEVVLVGEGLILLRLRMARKVLTASVPGEVTRVFPDQGVEITARGAVVDGFWGNGKLDYGLMQVVSAHPEEPLTAEKISVALRGLVVVGGPCREAKVLELANELPLRGLVVSSMEAALIPLARQMDIPVFVIEGFGQIPMHPVSYRLLKSHEQREIAVVAETPDRHQGIRPQLVIALDVSNAPEVPDVQPVEPERKVRITRAPYVGRRGVVIRVRRDWLALPLGVRARVAEVRLESGEQVVVPLSNLETLS